MIRNHWMLGLTLSLAPLLWLVSSPAKVVADDSHSAVPAVRITVADNETGTQATQVRHRYYGPRFGFYGGWGYPGFSFYYGRPYHHHHYGYYYPRHYYTYPYYSYYSYPYSYGYWW